LYLLSSDPAPLASPLSSPPRRPPDPRRLDVGARHGELVGEQRPVDLVEQRLARRRARQQRAPPQAHALLGARWKKVDDEAQAPRSEEHTSELPSLTNLLFRLLLQQKT